LWRKTYECPRCQLLNLIHNFRRAADSWALLFFLKQGQYGLTIYRGQPNPSPGQHPRPKHTHKGDIEEIKDQGTTENERVVRPRVVRRHADARDDDRPGHHPREVGAEGLVEEPARDGGEQDGGELVVEGVKDVAPVNGLERRWLGYIWNIYGNSIYLPHFLSDVCNSL